MIDEDAPLDEASQNNPDGTGAGPAVVSIADEMQSAYLDYAMSVIVSRAIPDLRDGLKPVHRRILYAMHESGNLHDKPYRKSARPVGEVMGKYHPHGDGAIYDALVRMAQDFSMSMPLLDGQGNFGSMDGDNPAAMRYTEVRMAAASGLLLTDIDRDTVDFQDNYDGKDQEPQVLPARFPHILVNGGSGIAVGMATKIPPHNLGEIVDATLAMIEDPDISLERLIDHVPGPDFPTGGIIDAVHGPRRVYATGHGKITIRARTEIVPLRKDRQGIIVTEIPYQVNKSSMVERIAELARDRAIEGIAHIQDESDRFGVRIVIELKRDATPEVVLNQLWRQTPMETAFNCHLLALNGGRPELLNLQNLLRAFIEFREDVVARRTADNLRRARERSHILCGLAVAVSNLDEVVRIIRGSANPAAARTDLMERCWPAAEIADYIRLIDDPVHVVREDGTYRLSELQARAILDLRLQRLTAMGVAETTEELADLAKKIADYLDILSSGTRIRAIISDELRSCKESFSTPRRTTLSEFEDGQEDEDFIEREDMVVTVTAGGYIKRTPLSEFRFQKRGGKGLSGMATKDEDFVTSQHVVNTHDALLFFSTDGKAFKLKAWRLPKAGRNARGKAIVNILPITEGASIVAITPITVDEEQWEHHQIVFASSEGKVRRNRLSDFANVKSNGKIAFDYPPGVSMVAARICSEEDDILLATASGQALRFPIAAIRVSKSRKSDGIRGIKLRDDDTLVAMEVINSHPMTPDEREEYLRLRRAESASDDDSETAAPMFGIVESVVDTEADGQAPMPILSIVQLPVNLGADAHALSLADEDVRERYDRDRAAETLLLTVTVTGSGKITSSHNYPVKGRGGYGVRAMKGGEIVAFTAVKPDDQIVLATASGQTIRCDVSGISFRSRSAGGVNVFNAAEGDAIVAVATTGTAPDQASSMPDDDGHHGDPLPDTADDTAPVTTEPADDGTNLSVDGSSSDDDDQSSDA